VGKRPFAKPVEKAEDDVRSRGVALAGEIVYRIRSCGRGGCSSQWKTTPLCNRGAGRMPGSGGINTAVLYSCNTGSPVSGDAILR